MVRSCRIQATALRILDLDQGRLEPDQLVLLPLEQPSERRELDALFLEEAVGKDLAAWRRSPH
jgi:hypothetical protein